MLSIINICDLNGSKIELLFCRLSVIFWN